MAEREADPETVEGGGRPLPRGLPTVRWLERGVEKSVTIGETMLLGSAENVALRIQDPSVSRLHAELEPHADGIRVRDLGSKNGSFVGAVRIERAIVPDGETFRVGGTAVRVVYEPSPSQAAPRRPGAGSFHGLVGQSDASRALFALLELVAASDAPALVTGETGTGKELVARALHDASKRHAGPFVVVDCAALPEALLEGELFGHAKGAFTGAVGARAGAFEAANGGTVFLDEIGELPLPMQPKLLRVLESKSVRRIGETSHRAVDVRFVAATHRDLPGMVARGSFREDLFFRLAVLPVRIAPLRDRPADLPVLLAQFEKRLGRSLPLDIRQRARLGTFPWPGNVRELRNFVDRVAALGADHAFDALSASEGAAVEPAAAVGTGAALSAPLADGKSMASADMNDSSATNALPVAEGGYRAFRDEWSSAGDRLFVRALLERHQGNVVEAAAEAQIDKSYFYRLVRREK